MSWKKKQSLIDIYFSNDLADGGEIDTMDPEVYEIGIRYNLLESD